MKASIVLGLAFGDEGKGMATDYLCSLSKRSIAIRFSGGQQAGHTVIRDGKKHIHSSFGSASLQNKPTYFTAHCCIYPPAIYYEKKQLHEMGLNPKLYVHPLTKVATPYDIIWNHIHETIAKHGSCGMGIGTTMKRHLTTGFKLYAMDFNYPYIAQVKMDNIRNEYIRLAKQFGVLEEFKNRMAAIEDDFKYMLMPNLYGVQDYSFLEGFDNLVFEGSQGILLDMDHGFFPNVTYANTVSKNAIEICNQMGILPEIYYITRCYQTRHGNGWMSETGDIKLINNEEEINTQDDWQGTFRIQEIDYDLINYALEIDSHYSGGYLKNLIVTCLDQRPGFTFDYTQLNTHFNSIFENNSPKVNHFKEIL